MKTVNNKNLNETLNILTEDYLNKVVGLFISNYKIEDTDNQVVYDLKLEVIEKYLPMFDIELKEKDDKK